jgi:hypothetical protein
MTTYKSCKKEEIEKTGLHAKGFQEISFFMSVSQELAGKQFIDSTKYNLNDVGR